MGVVPVYGYIKYGDETLLLLKNGDKIDAIYSSIQDYSQGRTVRDWLSQFDFEYQYSFGIDRLKDFGIIN